MQGEEVVATMVYTIEKIPTGNSNVTSRYVYLDWIASKEKGRGCGTEMVKHMKHAMAEWNTFHIVVQWLKTSGKSGF